MGPATHQIESDIERTREALGANLQELGQKVQDITDWRYHFQNHPMTLIGAAFGGGILLAKMLGRTRSSPTPRPASGPVGHSTQKAVETWDKIKDALLAVAATRVTNFVGELVPGFAEEFRSKTRT